MQLKLISEGGPQGHKDKKKTTHTDTRRIMEVIEKRPLTWFGHLNIIDDTLISNLDENYRGKDLEKVKKILETGHRSVRGSGN